MDSITIYCRYKTILLNYLKNRYAVNLDYLKQFKFKYQSKNVDEIAKFERSITSSRNNDLYFYLDHFGNKHYILQAGFGLTRMTSTVTLKCDWCFIDFSSSPENPPKVIPTRLAEKDGVLIIVGRGKHCCWACALAKAIFFNTAPRYRQEYVLALIHECYEKEYRISTGKEPKKLVPSPLPELATWNGGPLSRDIFFGQYTFTLQPSTTYVKPEVVLYEMSHT